MPYDPSLVTNEVLAILRTAEDPDVPVDERRVGDGDGPDPRTRPYGVVYLVDEPSADADGTWGDPHDMAVIVLQVSSVGDNREQAQLHQWWMRQLILGRAEGAYRHPIEGDGWKVYKREHDGGAGEPDRPGDAVLFTFVDRFRLSITRA